jgi:quinoprotein glucose dehydrogenase
VLDQKAGRSARKLELVGAGVYLAALAVLIPIFNQRPAPLQLPPTRADIFFEDSE